MTVTGAVKPGTASVPLTCGSGGVFGAGGSRWQALANSSVAIARLRRMAIKDGLLAEFDHETAAARRLLERIPDEKLAWQPHAKSRTLGALATHLSELPEWTDAILNRAQFDLAAAPAAAPPAASRAALLATFDRHAASARSMLDKTDGELSAYWSLRRGDQEIFTMPRVSAFRTFVLYHLVHHRGQLTVYLRLNDIPVPSIYGPSADEG